MKNALRTIVTLCILIMTISCSTNQFSKEPKEIQKTFQKMKQDYVLQISGDKARVRIATSFAELLQAKYRNIYPLVDSLIIDDTHKQRRFIYDSIERKKSIGFFVNNVGVPYSNRILKSSQKDFGINSHLSQKEQLEIFEQGSGLCVV